MGGGEVCSTDCPHEKQKRAAGGRAVPQFAHDWTRPCPHSRQKRASIGFSVAQFEQITGSPSIADICRKRVVGRGCFSGGTAPLPLRAQRGCGIASIGMTTSTPFGRAPVQVTVTGAAGNIGYALLFRLASGELFGPEQPVVLRLLEIEPAMKALEGSSWNSTTAPSLCSTDVVATSDLKAAFDGSSYVFLVGSIPRKAGMERKDLLGVNGGIFKPQGEAIAAHATSDVRILVVGNPEHEWPDRPFECAGHSRPAVVRHDPPRREPCEDPAREAVEPAGRHRDEPRRMGEPLLDTIPWTLRRRGSRGIPPRRSSVTTPGCKARFWRRSKSAARRSSMPEARLLRRQPANGGDRLHAKRSHPDEKRRLEFLGRRLERRVRRPRGPPVRIPREKRREVMERRRRFGALGIRGEPGSLRRPKS